MHEPIQHPEWCDLSHGDMWPAHSAYLGEIAFTCTSGMSVEISQYDDRPVTVTFVEHSSDEERVTELTSLQARDLARMFVAAADILDAGQKAML